MSFREDMDEIDRTIRKKWPHMQWLFDREGLTPDDDSRTSRVQTQRMLLDHFVHDQQPEETRELIEEVVRSQFRAVSNAVGCIELAYRRAKMTEADGE